MERDLDSVRRNDSPVRIRHHPLLSESTVKLIEVTKAFATEEQCLAYLEAKRWPNGVGCLRCGSKEISRSTRKVTKKSDNKRAQLYQCLEPSCKAQFSATTGTIFNGSHLPLDKWYMAIALIVDAKKGMSARQWWTRTPRNSRASWKSTKLISAASSAGTPASSRTRT